MDGEQAEGQITRLLARARVGDPQALGDVYTSLYDELKQAAHQQLRRLRGPLEATELVHEAYVKLVGGAALSARDRHHLLAMSARAMRQVLVDKARQAYARKRDGGYALTLTTQLESGEQAVFEVLALDELLGSLRQIDERAAQVVELRYFGGYSESEIAQILDVVERTVRRDWRRARVFLLEELEK
ncbi:MAG: sigma-70 family RNA polymerase sigma factor [Proteobacteria bacterium]|nr:sigma-70 family RNA polymerase sigma factor [Pseudomonadota bacterium]